MEIYIFIYIVLFIAVFIRPLYKNSSYLYFCILFFSLLIGFRGVDVGDDTYNYMRIYRTVRNDNYSGSTEFVYIFFNRICAYLGLSFSMFQTITVFLFLLFTAKAIKKISPYYNLSVFFLYTFFFVCYAMNIIREMLACFFAVSAYPYLYSKKKLNKLKYIIIVLIAANCHLSALVMLPLVIIDKIRINSLIITICIIGSLGLGFMLSVDNLAIFMGKYSRIMHDSGNERPDQIKILFLSLYWIIEFLLLYYFSNNQIRNSVFMKIMLVYVVVNNLLIQQAYGLRVVLYYNILQILLIPFVIRNCKKNRGLIRLIFVFYISILFFVFLSINSATVVPYRINDIELY